jgi:ubiquinone/menaquinone biosynthesis C-methylase UbiE
VDAFDRRASSYDKGRLGQWHLLIAQRTADVALHETPTPRRILDVGCGTGMLLHELADRVSETVQLAGVDPAPGMVSRSRASLESDPRIVIEQGAAEQLPFGAGVFDLVVSTMSFDHWSDQSQGLGECKRVLQDGGRLVIADLFAAWLRPTVMLGRRERARTIQQATQVLEAAGLRDLRWHRIYDLGPFPLVRAVIGRG